MGLLSRGLEHRARRALERQLDYQRAEAERLAGREAQVMARMARDSLAIRQKIGAVRPVHDSDRVLEVGSGSRGLIFFFGTQDGVGVDPLADEYRTLFPAWHDRARTVAVGGEDLPFDEASFDLVLCDNIVDHATDPRRIVAEMARVLRPGGLLYFTVNVHHPAWHAAASAHAGWRALGLPFEITPFADHTVHLTPKAARALFDGLPFRFLTERDTVAETKAERREVKPRHAADRVKRLFYKNALFETIAERA